MENKKSGIVRVEPRFQVAQDLEIFGVLVGANNFVISFVIADENVGEEGQNEAQKFAGFSGCEKMKEIFGYLVDVLEVNCDEPRLFFFC